MIKDYNAFPRPRTRFNKGLDFALGYLATKPRHILDEEKVFSWQVESLRAYESAGYNVEILEKCSKEPLWCISGDLPPSSTWFGEVLFAQGKVPKVIVYQNSVTSRLPSLSYELAGQSGVDHLIGHLYPFYKGEIYDEAVACRNQYNAAQARGWNTVAAAVVLIQALHKEIPVANYKR